MRRAWEALLFVAALVVVINLADQLLDGVLPTLLVIAALLAVIHYGVRRHANNRKW